MNIELITLILIDDHPVVRAGYRHFFESTKEIVVLAEAGDGETGCALYQECQPEWPSLISICQALAAWKPFIASSQKIQQRIYSC
ncbi:MAG: hypothetical protein RQ714_03825 [Nitrosomonas sp.]|nr:hypothetical protein [Nitrosomonas sp.]